eukprot:COSAG06_NODE_52003_length_308_cov_1.191388_1_plen_37_part_01
MALAFRTNATVQMGTLAVTANTIRVSLRHAKMELRAV